MKRYLPYLFFTLLVAACGQPYCIVGLGDCDKMYKGADQQIGQGGKLFANPVLVSTGQGAGGRVRIGDSVRLNLTGGIKKYFCSVTPTDCGTVDCDSSYTYTPKQPGRCEITIKDSSPTPDTIYVTLNNYVQ